MGNNFKC